MYSIVVIHALFSIDAVYLETAGGLFALVVPQLFDVNIAVLIRI
jgi:hypothetical protein